MARRKNKILKPKRNTFAFVVEGKTESWYLQMMKRNEQKLQINIEPKIPQKKELKDLFNKVIELAENNTKVFWIIDVDKIIKESKEAKKGKKTPFQSLKEILKKLENHKNVTIILNNPCLEFWFLLHYSSTTKYFPKCEKVIKELKNYLYDYEKNEKYFTKQNNDIYIKLKPYLNEALKNARTTQRNNLEEIEQAICEMNLIFEDEQIKPYLELKKLEV